MYKINMEQDKRAWDGIFDAVRDGIALLDTGDKITGANKALAAILGIPVNKIMGNSYWKIIYNTPDPIKGCPVLRTKETLKRETLEISYRDKILEISVDPLLDEKGKYAGAIQVFRDITHRKQTEQALRESEEKYRTLLQASPSAISLTMLNGNFIMSNNKAIELFGFKSVFDCVGKNILNLVAKEDKGKAGEFFKNVIETGSAAGEFKIKDLSGKEFTGETNAGIIYDSSRNPLYIFTIIRDVTGRKTMEQELVFRNAILSTQQETNLDGILVVDENGKIISSNRRFAEIWGIPDEIMASKSDQRALEFAFKALVNPEEFLAKVKHLYNSRNETSRDEIYLKDGRTLDRYSAPMFGEDGKYYGRVWYFRDISRRKKAEKALQESEEKYRQLVETSLDYIFVISKDLKVQYVNHASEKLFNKTAAQIVGLPLEKLFPPQIYRQMRITLENVFETGRNVLTERCYTFPAGAVWLSVGLSPIRDEKGAIVAVHGASRDITELKLSGKPPENRKI
ncbi:MAG: hypothetical protein A2297_04735 [Elusimicrobia bacterium RIFOXYB2_FULL_48_7]|nr:MAG: hypothetical protein A2297_04735 [Elusimicrobia bacterium RIFOXYB2_FULL_48_7]